MTGLVKFSSNWDLSPYAIGVLFKVYVFMKSTAISRRLIFWLIFKLFLSAVILLRDPCPFSTLCNSLGFLDAYRNFRDRTHIDTVTENCDRDFGLRLVDANKPTRSLYLADSSTGYHSASS